jgi:hypothetical protein
LLEQEEWHLINAFRKVSGSQGASPMTAPTQSRARISPNGHTSELAFLYDCESPRNNASREEERHQKVSSLSAMARSQARISPSDFEPQATTHTLWKPGTRSATTESTERSPYLTTAAAVRGSRGQVGGKLVMHLDPWSTTRAVSARGLRWPCSAAAVRIWRRAAGHQTLCNTYVFSS